MVAQFAAVVVVFFFHKSDFPRKVNGNGRQKPSMLLFHIALIHEQNIRAPEENACTAG